MMAAAATHASATPSLRPACSRSVRRCAQIRTISGVGQTTSNWPRWCASLFLRASPQPALIAPNHASSSVWKEMTARFPVMLFW